MTEAKSQTARLAFTMTKKSHLSRPAASAIAAFLALSTSALGAQTTATDVAPVPTVSDDAPQIRMTPPVIVPDVPVEPATTSPILTETSMNSETVAPPIVTIPQPRAKSNVKHEPKLRSNPRSAQMIASSNEMPTEPSAVPPATVPNISSPTVTAPASLPPAAHNDMAVNDDTAIMWGLLGGGAALLLVGGAGFAAMRRRRTARPIVGPIETGMMDTPSLAYAPIEPQGHETGNPITPRARPSLAAGPKGTMGRHEAAAIAGPTPDNPFLTLKKRLTHARFYDRMERMEQETTATQTMRKPTNAWEIAKRSDTAPEVEQVVRRPGRRPFFPAQMRPGYSGN